MGRLSGGFSPFLHRIIVATGILLFAIVYLFEIDSLKNAQDKLLVNPVIWIIILLYPIIIWQEWRERQKESQKESQASQQLSKEAVADDETSAKLSRRVFFFMISTLLYLILMNYLGFFIMTIIFMPLLMLILGTRSRKILIILPLVATILFYFLFNNLLGIPLPAGILLEGVF